MGGDRIVAIEKTMVDATKLVLTILEAVIA